MALLHEEIGSDAGVSKKEPAAAIPGRLRRGRVERHRHRGRRDGGAPPRTRIPRVGSLTGTPTSFLGSSSGSLLRSVPLASLLARASDGQRRHD